jgi:hypothetical protein
VGDSCEHGNKLSDSIKCWEGQLHAVSYTRTSFAEGGLRVPSAGWL